MNIGDYINYLFEVGADSNRRLRNMAIFLAVAILVATGINFGYKPLNGVIGFIVVFRLLVASIPQKLLVTFGLGAASNPMSPINTGKKTLKTVNDHYMSFLTWTSAIFLFAATMEFKQNPGAIMIILPALMLIALAEYGFKYQTHFARPIVFIYAVLCVCVCLGSVVPKMWWYNTIGRNPYSYFSTSTERQINVDRLEFLEAKEALTPAEEAEFKVLKEKAIKRSFLGFVSNGLNEYQQKKAAEAKKQADAAQAQSLIAPPAQKVAVTAPTTPDGIKNLSSGFHYVNPVNGRTPYWIEIAGGKHIQFYDNSNNYTVVLEDTRRFNMWSEEDKARFRNMPCLNQKFYIETQNLITTNPEGKPFAVAIEVS